MKKPKYATDQTSSGWAWSDIEILMIKKLYDDGASDKEIAEELGRSESSVSFIRHKYNIVRSTGSGNYRKKVWLPAEEDELIDMTKRCVKLVDIAKYFSVSHHAISKKLEELGMAHYHRKHCRCAKEEDEEKKVRRKDKFESRFFGSYERAIGVAKECRGYILEYSMSGYGLPSNDGRVRVQFALRTTKDKDCLRRLNDCNLPINTISARLDNDILLENAELARLFTMNENWKGEVFVRPEEIKEAKDDNNENYDY